MSRNPKVAAILCSAIALCVLGGCPFVVVYPAAMQTTSQDFELDNGRIRITVVFSKAVDMSSLIAGTNVILDAEKDHNANLTITAGSDSRTIVITTVDTTGDLLTFDPDGFFTLMLLGSGDNPIRSTDGDILDGDGDGTAGGDYETTFVLIG